MKIFKTLAAGLLLSVSTLFTACTGGSEKEANPLADSLSTENSKKDATISEKEAAIQDFVTAFNEIQDNLNTIKEKEKIVSTTSKTGDVKSKEDQIKEDIQAIYDMMAKNKNRIGSLSKKLKESNVKLEGLEQMIATLQAQLESKDGEIATLKAELEAKNIDMSNLQANYEEVTAESSAKTEKLNTAYYAIGTAKELKEKGVTTKEGGFIGLGKSTTLKADFNKDYFTKVDVSTTTSITIGAKKAKLLSTHPSSSYKLVGDKTVERIEITNPDDFWSASKYLVIVTE
ncbi:MAG: hypothetical protein JST26_01710 [Bacteroidetes bacterium]|nr:hypothetical protein [Bacteroidota bacterium]